MSTRFVQLMMLLKVPIMNYFKWALYFLQVLVQLVPFLSCYAPHSCGCVATPFILVVHSKVWSLWWIPPCYSFLFKTFASLNDGVVVIMQFLTLLQALLTTCFRWAPLVNLFLLWSCFTVSKNNCQWNMWNVIPS